MLVLMIFSQDICCLLFFFYWYISYVYSILPSGQKRAPDLLIDFYEPPSGCWELNSGPLEEQPVLLTSKPFLQSLQSGYLNLVMGLSLLSVMALGIQMPNWTKQDTTILSYVLDLYLSGALVLGFSSPVEIQCHQKEGSDHFLLFKQMAPGISQALFIYIEIQNIQTGMDSDFP